MIGGLILKVTVGLYLVCQVLGSPTAEYTPSRSFTLLVDANEVFPDAKQDMDAFSVGATYDDYPTETENWLKSLNPVNNSLSVDEKANMLLEIAYIKEFDTEDVDMQSDKYKMISAVNGTTTDVDLVQRGIISPRSYRNYIVSHSHVVVWHACSAFFSCVTGESCQVKLDIGHAPRSHCANKGGQNCCVSWTDYTVRVGFFETAWVNCDNAVQDDNLKRASCEGSLTTHHGNVREGVCFSNRATGCT